MEDLFIGKVALVTGAATDIGQAVAFSYAANGAKVIVSDTRDNKTVAKIKAKGGEASFIKTDVSNASDCEQLIKKTIDTYGKIDIAFNNAGILGETNNLSDMNLDGFEKVIDVNLNGVFYCMKYEIEAMLKQRRGVIINTACILGVIGFATFSGYIASKQSVVRLTQNAALEYSDKGIRINCVAPGFINTPLLSLKHPTGRLGKPDEVAALITWLSSEKASYSMGSYYPIDGGHLAN